LKADERLGGFFISSRGYKLIGEIHAKLHSDPNYDHQSTEWRE